MKKKFLIVLAVILLLSFAGGSVGIYLWYKSRQDKTNGTQERTTEVTEKEITLETNPPYAYVLLNGEYLSGNTVLVKSNSESKIAVWADGYKKVEYALTVDSESPFVVNLEKSTDAPLQATVKTFGNTPSYARSAAELSFSEAYQYLTETFKMDINSYLIDLDINIYENSTGYLNALDQAFTKLTPAEVNEKYSQTGSTYSTIAGPSSYYQYTIHVNGSLYATEASLKSKVATSFARVALHHFKNISPSAENSTPIWFDIGLARYVDTLSYNNWIYPEDSPLPSAVKQSILTADLSDLEAEEGWAEYSDAFGTNQNKALQAVAFLTNEFGEEKMGNFIESLYSQETTFIGDLSEFNRKFEEQFGFGIELLNEKVNDYISGLSTT